MKGLLYLPRFIRLKAGVNIFIRKFIETFYFPSDFIVVVENF